MVNDINDLDVPSDPGFLYQELVTARQNYQRYRNLRTRTLKESLAALDAAKSKILEGLSGARKKAKEGCSKAGVPEQAAAGLAELYAFTYVPGYRLDSTSEELRRVALLPKDQPCRELAAMTEGNAIQGALDKDLESARKKANDQIQFAAAIGDAWQKRLLRLTDAKNKGSEASSLSKTLVIIIAVVSLFACLVLFAVKLFEPPLQMELVASGQLIQFPTVMILLVVIVSLGLSNIIKDSSLAALLGAIAGYVLSQGVGRAAARQAVRQLQQGQEEQQP